MFERAAEKQADIGTIALRLSQSHKGSRIKNLKYILCLFVYLSIRLFVCLFVYVCSSIYKSINSHVINHKGNWLVKFLDTFRMNKENISRAGFEPAPYFVNILVRGGRQS